MSKKRIILYKYIHSFIFLRTVLVIILALNIFYILLSIKYKITVYTLYVTLFLILLNLKTTFSKNKKTINFSRKAAVLSSFVFLSASIIGTLFFIILYFS